MKKPDILTVVYKLVEYTGIVKRDRDGYYVEWKTFKPFGKFSRISNDRRFIEEHYINN